jgi:hypothetical protein
MKMYGRTAADEWIKSGKITPLRVGKSLRFDKREVETVAASDIFNVHICKIEL